jgi:hypothetical protein
MGFAHEPMLLAAAVLFRRWPPVVRFAASERPMTRQPGRRSGTAVALLCLFLGACRKPESPEVARARAGGQFLKRQIEGLEALVAKAERGELVTSDQIAIGVEEKVAKDLLNAPLPRDVTVDKRLRIRIESAEPYFRGNQAGLVFRAHASLTDAPSFSASIELGGGLDEFRLEGGRLSARVKLLHFALLDSNVSPLGQLAETLIRDHWKAIEDAIPPIVLPVQLEPDIRIAAERMGPVTVKPGELPLRIEVSEVVPVGQRLWVLLDVHAGPWKPGDGAGS